MNLWGAAKTVGKAAWWTGDLLLVMVDGILFGDGDAADPSSPPPMDYPQNYDG